MQNPVRADIVNTPWAPYLLASPQNVDEPGYRILAPLGWNNDPIKCLRYFADKEDLSVSQEPTDLHTILTKAEDVAIQYGKFALPYHDTVIAAAYWDAETIILTNSMGGEDNTPEHFCIDKYIILNSDQRQGRRFPILELSLQHIAKERGFGSERFCQIFYHPENLRLHS